MDHPTKFEADNLTKTIAKQVADILRTHGAGIILNEEKYQGATFHIHFDDKSALQINWTGFSTGHVIFDNEVN
jgi:hypothetical protein